ncbi:hypothetical protein [Nocardia sp. NBC_00416]|uniref:hypothetical protein n=1 Tax=Nocardia sp. NBC_00416 TaxID=2975991 RepID=UPI002E21FED4
MLHTWTVSAHDPGLVADLASKQLDSALGAVAASGPVTKIVGAGTEIAGLVSGTTNVVSSTTHRILQAADLSGTHGVPSSAPAIAILTRASSSVQKLAGLGAED